MIYLIDTFEGTYFKIFRRFNCHKKTATILKKTLLGFAFLFAAPIFLAAQDIHFSQYYNTPLNLNPALTGVFKGDLRFIGNYRSQWQAVPVPYLTFSGSFDQKIPLKFIQNGVLAGGLLFNYDKAGDGNFSLSQLGLNAGYTHQLTDQLFLGGGFLFSLGQRGVQPDKLTFEEQWNGDVFDPNVTHTEQFDNTSISMASISAGINAHFQIEGTRTKVDWGFSLYHINRPSESFLNNSTAVLPLKQNSYTLAEIQIHPLMDIRFHALYSIMDFGIKQNELVGGLAYRYHLSLQKSREISLLGGISYRIGDAIIPTIEVQYFSWMVGLSYDINISDFNIATQKRGGPEFSIRYIITKVKAPKVFKVCPIF